jgi:hypothetical protein
VEVLIETYRGRQAVYSITDAPYGLGLYDEWKFINRANAVSLARSHPETWRIPGYIVPERQTMSWLTSFLTILHAVEVADQLAAPIVAAAVGGTDGAAIAGMMTQANAAAVGIEAISNTFTTPMTGEQKAAVVTAGTNATFTAINSILTSQGKQPLSPTIVTTVGATVKTVVEGMKAIGAAVGPVAPATPAPPAA